MKIRRLILACTLPAIALSLLLASCGGSSRYTQMEGIVWNTTFHITFRGPESLKDSVLAAIDEVGRSLNFFDEKSTLSRVNAAEGPVQVDSHFRNVYLSSLEVNRRSGGRFDPTLSPLITAWGFGKGHEATSDTARVDSLLKLVGIRRTRLEGMTLTKENPSLTFNFSAIAKGYGCDYVAEVLRRNGVTDYMVEIGGEIAAGGESPRGGKWRISVDRPLFSRDEIHESEGVTQITGCGMATSGNYRNFHTRGSQRWGHTINAVTGRPDSTDIVSATIVAPSAMLADAYATSAMALGSAKAEQMVMSLGLGALFVLADSTVWTHNFPLSDK